MSLSNYTGLKASLAAWSARSDLTAQLDDFAFWAHQEISRRLRCNLLLASSDALNVAAETLAVPSGFLAIKRFYIDPGNGASRTLLKTVSADQAADISASWGTADYPDSVAVEGSNFRFAPLFSTATTGHLLYYAAPALMSADADTNVVLSAYPYLYLFGALEALFSYLEDDNNADRYGQKFGALLEDINARDAKDLMGGSLQTQATRGMTP